MTTDAFVGLGIALGVLLVLLAMSVRIVPEYERGVIFRLGRIIGAKGPGLFFLIPVVDRMVRVSLRTTTMDIPPQDVITKDNVTVKVNAVTYFNVVDPNRSVIAIENYVYGTSQVAQTTLRSMLGQIDLDELLSKREEINQRLQQIIDELTNPWGVKVTLVEVKDVELPEAMRRAMARQAEAERDRRAKVIHAHGEFEAAETLGNAAVVLERHPAAMQLRVLSTMIEVAGERNSTLIFPIPVELMRLVDSVRATLGDRAGPRDPVGGPMAPHEPQPTGQSQRTTHR
jgi:regulator of protease activity HflC (stomatin/prohibitin superfamily)